MMKKTILFLLLAFFALFANAQNTTERIKQFKEKTNAKITISPIFGIPDFIRFSSQNAIELQGNTLKEKVTDFLNSNKEIFKIKSIHEFYFEKEQTDQYGLSSIVLKQNHNGISVFDGKLTFHFNKKQKLTAINGNYIPQINLNTTSTISRIQANTIAIREIKNQQLNNSKQPLITKNNKLYIFYKGLVQNQIGRNYLVYRIEVTNELDVREFLFINAKNGKIVAQFTGIAHAVNRIIFENDTSNIVWQEGDAFPGTLSIWQQNEVNVSKHAYNFFKNAFNYNSYDNAEAQMRTINNNPNINCPNANWNGTTVNYCDGTASDDVIAHEWAHAYTEYTSGLIYAYQSGAINEAYSDIWGETVDLINNYEDTDEDLSLRHSCGSSQRWMMGEDATAFGGAIRDMWDPTCKGDPGKVNDASNYVCSSNDNGGVHTNSGIPNHTYALLVDGGFYNNTNINGIGLIKAAHIFWRAQTQYLTPTSDFSNLADALETSCSDLIGVNLEGLSTTVATGLSGEVITNADLNSVINTLLAVELRTNTNCNFQTILAPINDLCSAATSNPIFFEDWESGIGNWTLQQLPVQAATWESRDWEIVGNLPKNRAGNAMFAIDPINGNCGDDLENGIIRLQSPLINLPEYNSGKLKMAFTHNVSTEQNWDGGNLKYTLDGLFWSLVPASAFLENPYNDFLNDVNDNPMHGEAAFTGSDEGGSTSSWGTSVIDFSVLGVQANSSTQSIQFRWEMGTDGCNGRIGWYIDDIVIYNCSQALNVTEQDIKDNISIYPNPSNGIFTLKKMNGIEIEEVAIYDITGRLIKNVALSINKNEYKIDLTNTVSNLFFFKITGNNTSTTLKLLKK